MNKSETLSIIRKLMTEIFPSDTISEDVSELSIGSLKEWDSLGNFNFLLAIENEFNVRFSMEEIGEIKSVAQIMEFLDSHHA
tara:strand:- start:480 stop:725 length:246 start_codon:yes stop_codon:yes gene_type:complete